MMKTLLLLLSTSLTPAIWLLLTILPSQAYGRPDYAQQFEKSASGSDNISSTTLKKKKKIDLRKREQFASDTIRTFNEQISSGTLSTDDFRIQFHKRQIEKRARLEVIHAQVSEKLDAHHSGRSLLTDAELESHTKKQMALKRKRKSLEEETPEGYIERMKRHEEKVLKKVERKDRRREERFRKMMGGEVGGEL